MTRMGYRVHARGILDLRNAAVGTAANADANIGARRCETDAEIRGFEQILNYAHRSIILSVRENAGFGAERMARLVDGSYWIGRGYIDKYSPMAKTDDEYAIDSYYAMRVELGYVGYDPSVELWPDVPFSVADMGLRGKQTASMRAENAFYLEFANKMSFYVREMAADAGSLQRVPDI